MKIIRIAKMLVLSWIAYVVTGVIIPPLFQKSSNDVYVQEKESCVTEPERILSIDTNSDALLWRLRLIEAANERIVLATFDFRDDNSGKDIMSAILNAADRGIKVQILIDGINGGLRLKKSNNFRNLVSHENVEARLYNPVNLLKPWKLNYRMHDKYIIADDFAYILGGRNTDDLFLGNYTESWNEDRDILVYETVAGRGKSYIELQEYFEHIWDLPCSKPVNWSARGEDYLSKHYQKVRIKYNEAYTKVEWEKTTIETEEIKLCTNPIEAVNKRPILWEYLAEKMKQGENILIQTPYIICNRAMYNDLTEICTINPNTELIINSAECGSNPFGCTDYLNQKRKIQKTGIRTYEYLGEQALHTKSILIGDHISIVGSCNLDMRSVYMDTEMMLVINSRELNAFLREQAGELEEKSRVVLPDGTVLDGDNSNLNWGTGKMIFYQILRILIIPLRHLL